ncbi:MAG: pectinesterase family protein [Lachnoclostridium sp.]|nr:pectinesterase family protein [Lachnoclostridium sp.]
MDIKSICSTVAVAMSAFAPLALNAAIEGSLDPESVVEQWSDDVASPKIFDINFSDTSWPDTWTKETGRDCPEWADGGYVNAVLDVKVNPDGGVTYPVLFHNCVFANKKSYNGFAGATAAFSRQYYLGEKATGNSPYVNNWKAAGHTKYLEDNIEYNSRNVPTYGEAGFVQMCRDAAIDDGAGNKISLHGWMEIDHIPYVDRVQWSWSSTSWGRGIKCDYKVGDGDWKPLVWMGSERQKQGWTSFSDQGYFMENVINASDVSIRWRVWDGEDFDNPVQKDDSGACPFTQSIDPFAQRQAPRVHKIRIFGNEITADQADFARNNPVNNVGELSDLGDFGFGSGNDDAPDAAAPVVISTVSKDGTGDYASIQEAIDAVPAGSRGIIFIKAGVYDENIYASRKGEPAKFISLVGEDAATTILTSSVSRGGESSNSYLDCAALNVFCERFYAENLTIRNTSGNVGQAEALFTNGDAHLFNNCVLSGYQDTYKANIGSRGYFTNCVIEGCTDFIYDGGLEWFENCTIRCVNGKGYITAPAESSMPMTKVMYPELSADVFYPGLFFRNCNVVAEEGVGEGDYYLGRPWKETSGAMFISCSLGKHINAAGWKDWNGNEKTSSLYEYKNVDPSGQPVNTASRASFSRQASDAEVAAYMTPEFVFSKAAKTSFDFSSILAGVAAPADFVVTGSGFSWMPSEGATGYVIYKNGKLEAVVTDAEYSAGFDPAAVYTVKSISRHGVTSAAVEAKETEPLKAFPSAEGFGKYTSGGRGGKVVKVTSLADDGSAGTLRWAFSQYKDEPITIVFEVSGNIVLASELRVNRNDWTLAGQTAPGDGIVITHNKVNFGGSQNFIVRNVRFRIGQKDVNGQILTENACGSENCSNYIFDHCTFGWSVEENMNTADCHFLTVQYCMVHEGLYNAGHSKGVRGYGTQWGGSPATYHHNLLSGNQSRSCRFNGARGEDHVVFMEYINNVNYNYGKEGGCYGGENTAPVSDYNGLNSAHECNFINNYYKPGPASSTSTVTFFTSSYARDGATSWAPAKWYVDGNVAHGFDAITADNWKGVKVETYKQADIKSDARIVTATPYYKYSITGGIGSYVPERYMMENFQTATDAFTTVVNRAGTINRDAIESRVAADALAGTATYGGSTIGEGKGILDTENDAEGFIAYSENYTVPTDTDGDGMPDVWENTVGLNPAAADNNRLNADGYTALEVYLASLMGETLSSDFSGAGIAEVMISTPEMSYDKVSATLTIAPEAIGATLTVYSTDGAMLARQIVKTTDVNLSALQPGVYLICLSGNAIAPRSLKILR